MTEEEWLTATDPTPMAAYLRQLGASHRKRRLFACACCRRFWTVSPAAARSLIELAERYADKRYTGERVSQDQISQALRSAEQERRRQLAPGVTCALVAADCTLRFETEMAAAIWAARAVINDERGPAAEAALLGEQAFQTRLLRCVFGNPLRPTASDPRWLTPTAVAIAGGVYADQAFDRLPVLADCLEDAGCDNSEMLAHCRSEVPHVRGCWVVDLLLKRG